MTKAKTIAKSLLAAIVLAFMAMTLAACGTDPNAIVISSYEDLKAFLADYSQNEFLDTEIAEEGKYLLLTNDIDCQNEVLTPFLTTDYHGLEFKIDGNGHSISNFILDNSCIRDVGTAPGTSTSAYKVLSLFPRSDGGQLVNIEFKNVNYILSPDDDQVNVNNGGIKVGLVGYSKSTGSNETAESGHYTSLYQNIKLTNINVSVKYHASSATATKYPLSSGALIGLDADTTNNGANLMADSSMAIRENITVDNFNVNVDMNGGAIFVGGIAGQTHWMRVTYDNCSVTNSTFNVVNTGSTEANYTGSIALNDSVSLGGIVGGSTKEQHEIVITDSVTDVDYVVESGNAGANVNAGTLMGVVIESNSVDTDLQILNFGDTNTSTTTCTVGAVGEAGTALETIPTYVTK